MIDEQPGMFLTEELKQSRQPADGEGDDFDVGVNRKDVVVYAMLVEEDCADTVTSKKQRVTMKRRKTTFVGLKVWKNMSMKLKVGSRDEGYDARIRSVVRIEEQERTCCHQLFLLYICVADHLTGLSHHGASKEGPL